MQEKKVPGFRWHSLTRWYLGWDLQDKKPAYGKKERREGEGGREGEKEEEEGNKWEWVKGDTYFKQWLTVCSKAWGEKDLKIFAFWRNQK